MVFNNFHRTLFAVLLTIFIFATIVGVLCVIRCRERRRDEREDETRARIAEQRRALEERTRAEAERLAAPPDGPPPYQIDLPIWDPTRDLNAPGETPVSQPVSAEQVRYKMAENADENVATSSTCIRSISYTPSSTLI